MKISIRGILVLALLNSMIAACANTNADFRGHSKTIQGAFIVKHPVQDVFPLFNPINESKWAEGFEYTPVTPSPFTVSKDAIFTTKHHGSAFVWVINAYDVAAHRIEYIYVKPDALLTRITVACDALSDTETKVTVTYVINGLSDEGNQFVTSFDEEHIKGWGDAVNDYFDKQTGQGRQLIH